MHQAIQTQPAGKGQEPNTVAAGGPAGFMIHDRVLRPAAVIVAQSVPERDDLATEDDSTCRPTTTVCDACGHQFEEMQSFKAEPLKTCPKCGKDQLRRLFGTGAAILFKGGGFYETDYRSDGYKKAAEADPRRRNRRSPRRAVRERHAGGEYRRQARRSRTGRRNSRDRKKPEVWAGGGR